MDVPVILALSSTGLAFLAVAYRFIRPKFPLKVNCWFCNLDVNVPYHLQNNWTCPECEQYNGFNQNGDYNQVNPAFYDERYNSKPISAKSSGVPMAKRKNALCEMCNFKQELKIHQLATFEPINYDDYDGEFEIYNRRLEDVYRLCRACEARVCSTLGKQDSWLRLAYVRWKQGKEQDNILQTESKPGRGVFFRCLATLSVMLPLLLAFVMTAIEVHYLQQDSRKEIVPIRSLLPAVMLELVVRVRQYTLSLGLTGFACMVFRIVLNVHGRYFVTDIVLMFVWISYIVSLSLTQRGEKEKDLNLLRALLSMLCLCSDGLLRLLLPLLTLCQCTPPPHEKYLSEPLPVRKRSECYSSELDDSVFLNESECLALQDDLVTTSARSTLWSNTDKQEPADRSTSVNKWCSESEDELETGIGSISLGSPIGKAGSICAISTKSCSVLPTRVKTPQPQRPWSTASVYSDQCASPSNLVSPARLPWLNSNSRVPVLFRTPKCNSLFEGDPLTNRIERGKGSSRSIVAFDFNLS